MVLYKPRKNQKEVLAYRGGKMGVSAVPGSGKTQTLSYLAADLIASGALADDQEVLIVTLVNSAVDNFSQRIGAFIKERKLMPNLGYRVRTLHGLSHDIVRERPDLVGLDSRFEIIDESEAEKICEEAANAWMRRGSEILKGYLDPGLDQSKQDWVMRDQAPAMVLGIAQALIRYAKDMELTPEGLNERLVSLPVPLPLAEMGAAIYADYQRALAYRGAVDFDDLIRLALKCLKDDPDYLDRLRYRWPFILEDEAQDSSHLQEDILKLLAGPNGNWVRVGDPNQAIYETFTTASPQYLLDFLRWPGVQKRTLPNSGRSTLSIISLANALIDYTLDQHPVREVRKALIHPLIKPAPPRDPQPNPTDNPQGIELDPISYTPQEEVMKVVDSLEAWLPTHMDDTVAVLAPRNGRGVDVVAELKRRGIDYVEILRSTQATRAAAGALGNLIRYLGDPQSSSKLATVYKVWQRGADESTKTHHERVIELLRKCPQVEDYLWPRPDQDWLAELALTLENHEQYAALEEFREQVRRWQGTTLLPIDQIILTLAQDLFHEPADLATAHKLAAILRQAGQAHQDWRLPEMTEELAVVARNERRFLGFSEDDAGFDPDRYRGKVVVATIHKAKGLEWDRVYLMSVNNYDFPSAQPYDRYISERWYVRQGLNLEAEALAQLHTVIHPDAYAWYQEGLATHQARLGYTAERLRMLYVGITRARKELILTTNTGRDGKQTPSLPYAHLIGWWEEAKQNGS